MTDEELIAAIKAKMPGGQQMAPESIQSQAQPQLSDEALLAAIKAKQESEPESDVLHKAKLTGSALLRGAAKGASAIAEYAPVISPLTSMVSRGVKAAGLQPDFNAINQQISETGTQPQTPGEKYINAGTEGVGGALIPMGRAPMVVDALIGAGAGLGSEAGKNIGGENKYAPIVGALLAGATTGGLASMKGNASDLARLLVKDINVPEAKAAFEQAKKAGIPVTLANANPNKQTQFVNDFLSESSAGPQTQGVLKEQPNAAVNQLTIARKELGGEVLTPAQVETDAQATARKVISDFRKQFSAQYGQTVKDTGNAVIDPKVRQLAVKHFQALGANEPAMKSVYAPIIKALSDKNITTFGQFDRVLKQESGKIGSVAQAAEGLDKKTVGEAQGAIKNIRDRFAEAYAPEYKAANEAFSVQATALNALRKSPLGRLAKKGDLADKETAGRTIKRILSAGTNPDLTRKNLSEIRVVANALNPTDPTTFRNAVTSHISDEIHAALDSSGGTVTPAAVNEITKRLFGTDAKAQGMRDMLQGVAEGQKLKRPEIAFQGFRNVMETMRRIAKTEVRGSGEVGQELSKTAAKSTAGKIFRLPYLGNIAGWLDNFYTVGTMKKIDKMFTTPEGLDMLEQMAKVPPNSPLADSIFKGYIIGQSQSEE